MIRRKFYGWYDERVGVFRLSYLPPDSPIRPSIELKSRTELKEYLYRKRGDVVWSPPLPFELEA